MRTGGELLVECLTSHGVALWTCVPGESFLPVLDALYTVTAEGADGKSVRLITTRHEAAAANMAEAAGKLTGRAAVCIVTRGPGATHASIGLHTAYQDGTPLLLIVGQVKRSHLGREAFQEMDYERVFGSSAKSVITVEAADRIPELVAKAHHLAHAGRPGPVVLVFPEDVLSETTSEKPKAAPRIFSSGITAAAVKEILRRLDGAEKPLLLVGGTGWSQEIGDKICRFAEKNLLPVASAFRWQDAVHNGSPVFTGYLGLGCNPRLKAHALESDLIVALGPRFDDPTSDGYALTERTNRIVLVSESPEELTRTCVPSLAIQCSLASLADALVAAELRPSEKRSKWLAQLRADQEEFAAPPLSRAAVDLGLVISQVRKALSDDAIITNGAGNYTVWVQRFFEFRGYGTQLAPRNGAMGYGVPAGLAAAALHPDRQVVTFAGDGCFMMSGSELATAIQHSLRLVVIVVNNSMFGTIRMHQERSYPGRTIATDLRNPDFVAYARAFGALGLRVDCTEDFEAAFEKALIHKGLSLIEIRADPRQLGPDLWIDQA